jgi:copper chaperone NosL
MKLSGILMVIGSALLLGLFLYPLWNIRLEAPQYPDPLGMDIYIAGIEGEEEFDIQNIDGINHYIGMKKIPKPAEMWEFNVFPLVIGGMAGLGILLGVLGFMGKISPNWFLAWLVLMTILGILGMYDFNNWLLEYGTDLDPKAIIKLTDAEGNPLSYKPPLLGSERILNFTAHSYPETGAYMMFAGMFLTLVAWFTGIKAKKNRN